MTEETIQKSEIDSKMSKIKLLLFWILALVLQAVFLPTCNELPIVGTYVVYMALTIDILIPLRLFFKSSKMEKTFYITMLLSSAIWIKPAARLLSMFSI